MPLDDSIRIERELKASVVHFEVHSILCGLEAIDYRTDEEKSWERAWRSTPGRPNIRPFDVDMARVVRAVELRWQSVPDGEWSEPY